MRKIPLLWILSLTTVFTLAAVTSAADVTILYTNDVHTYIDKEVTYAHIAAYRDTFDGALLVDAGDHVQGTAYGGMDNGASISAIMNAAGYNAATLGNHEFDYTMSGCLDAIDRADFPYLSCNFYHEENGVPGENLLDSYAVFESNGVKIAFVGITTPDTMTSTAPAYFQDADGNFIYGIAGGADGAELYAAVQTAIDAASKEADYVIALGHLGLDNGTGSWTSEQVIANTSGLDAFIDGHSHTPIEMWEIEDKNGDTVLLTQAGAYLESIGQLTIAEDGTITSRLVPTEELKEITPDAEVKALEDAWIADVNDLLGEKIADSTVEFTVNDADGNRAVRLRSTNLSDFNADAYYWYINEREGLSCDVAIINGGGIRASVLAGDWTYNSCKSVNPFGNVLCIIELTGQDILDALEFTARYVGEMENGTLFHTAGLIYTVDTTIPNTVPVDDKDIWVGQPEKYRVKNVEVYDRETGTYEPLVLTDTYTMAGTNYTLRNGGGGCAMFNDATLVKDYIVEDYLALAAYTQSFADTDGDSYAEINSVNSPLYAYEGYRMDYENPEGSGRMTEVNENYAFTMILAEDGWTIKE